MTTANKRLLAEAPDGLHEFEAAMRARGRTPILRWVTTAHPSDVELHAGYCVGPSFVYVQAMKGGGWRAFVAALDNDADAVVAALDQRDPFSGRIFRAARAFAAGEPPIYREVEGGIEGFSFFRRLSDFETANEHFRALQAIGRVVKTP